MAMPAKLPLLFALIVAALVLTNAHAPNQFDLLKRIAQRPTVDPAPCCVSSKEFQFLILETIASWDVRGDNAGYQFNEMQVDQANNLLFAKSERVTPAPKLSTLNLWITPASQAGQWFEIYKILGIADCYIRTLTVKPDIFTPICFGPPFAYKGDVTIGTHGMSIWDEAGASYNETHFVQQDACLPTVQLGIGYNTEGDWEERQTSFLNIQLKVSDPSKFVPPTHCIPVPAEFEATFSAASSRLRSFV